MNEARPLYFKHFSRKSYSLFSVLGKVVLIGTLSVSTVVHARVDGRLTVPANEDTDIPDGGKGIELDEVQVTGSRAPMTAVQSAKIVSVITREDIRRAGAESINDILKMVAGVDVRQRGSFGVQTDISINGGTFDQITILLNGVSLSSPQTGHNTADFPLDLDDVERIEIIEGANSRIYGSNALNGAINIVTSCAPQSQGKISAEAGSFGTVTADGGLDIARSSMKAHLSGGYTRSDGGTDNSDFEKKRIYYLWQWNTRYANLKWQTGYTATDFGANTFYSAKFDNQYEETSRLLYSLQADIHDIVPWLSIRATLHQRFDRDHFQLIRGEGGAENGENYHKTNIYGGSIDLNAEWTLGKTSVGADIKKEIIYSTTYGEMMDESDWIRVKDSGRYYDKKGERTNASIYAEHNVILRKATFSAGLMANKNTGLDNDFRFYPGADISYRPNYNWKLYVSWNKAMRIPTYTDLYTSNKAQKGDPNLKPERNETFKIGARYRTRGLETVATAFYSRGKNMIDWVYETEDATQYHALNIGKLDNIGVSANATFSIPDILGNEKSLFRKVKIGYAYIHQDHDTEHQIYKSLYALEYLRHKFTAQVTHRIWNSLSANWEYRWQQRMNGYHPYSKIDCKIMWIRPAYEIYVKADNITCHRYYDIGDVRQPGIWIMAGAKITIR